MSDSTPSFSLVKALELQRRRDLARGVVKHALRLFLRRGELRESINECKKKAQSKWYWLFGVAGFVLHYLLASDPQKFSGWLLISGAAYLHYLGVELEQYLYGKDATAVQIGLGELEVQWLAATGLDTFWDLAGRVDHHDELETESKFREFSEENLKWLTERFDEYSESGLRGSQEH